MGSYMGCRGPGLRLGVLLVLVVAAGCARVATTTELKADGSFIRTMAFTVPKEPGAGPSDSAPQDPDKYFKLPLSDSKVRVVRSRDKNGDTLVTVTRTVEAGAPELMDLTLWGQEKGKALATSTVSVRRRDDGSLEYLETLRAVQRDPETRAHHIAEARARVKAALPAKYHQTETIDKITDAVVANFGHGLLGPPEPHFFDFLISPDATTRKLNAVAYRSNIASLREIVPQMTHAEAESVARALAGTLLSEYSKAPSDPSTSEKGSENDLTPLFFAVRFSGEVVETNGIVDPLSGEVYWSLLPMVLDLGDVRLRLVVRP